MEEFETKSLKNPKRYYWIPQGIPKMNYLEEYLKNFLMECHKVLTPATSHKSAHF